MNEIANPLMVWRAWHNIQNVHIINSIHVLMTWQHSTFFYYDKFRTLTETKSYHCNVFGIVDIQC